MKTHDVVQAALGASDTRITSVNRSSRTRRSTRFPMLRGQLSTFLLVLALISSGCGESSAARLELSQLNIPFTEMDFLEAARQGNSTAVSLFIDAGINLEAKDSAGQTALMVSVLTNQSETVRL